MRKLPDDARFLDEFVMRRAARELPRKQLHRDCAPDERVVRPGHAARGLFSDNLDDLVPPNLHGTAPLRINSLHSKHISRPCPNKMEQSFHRRRTPRWYCGTKFLRGGN